MKKMWSFIKNVFFVVLLVSFLIIFNVLIVNILVNNNFVKNANGVKYDITTNTINYYELAIKNHHLFPNKYNDEWEIKEFHYYSFKEEKYEIVLYVFFSDEDFSQELIRLNKFDYIVIEENNIEKRCYLLRNNLTSLYEYVVIDNIRKCIFYAYSYGISSDDSSINKKYRF